MLVVRKKTKAGEGVLHMELPETYQGKTLLVTIKTEQDIARDLLLDTVRVDTRGYVFDRDEIHGGR
ncbi:MAG: hypothetical protein RDU30_09595 [Desulfovibrionaceae bacterium]|nr:hypothetical protein [Desulfovibrionaceae bacterium]